MKPSKKILTAIILLSVMAFLTPAHAEEKSTKFTVGYDEDRFDRDLDTWHLYQLSLSQKTSLGTVVGRLNRAERFGDTGYQGEVDFYPSLGDGKYLYLNLGYANSYIFPQWRSGAEYYQSLPASSEFSLGIRLLQFDGEPVKIYTGSLSKYFGSFLVTLRPFYVPDTIGDSWSGSLALRYYINDDEYVSVSTGTGVASAEDVNLQIFEQHSQKASIDGKIRAGENFFVMPGASVQWFEFFPGIYRRQESYSLSLQWGL